MLERDPIEELRPGDRRIEGDGRNAVIDQVQLIAPQVLDRGGIGRAPGKVSEPQHDADVVGLGLGIELAHPLAWRLIN